MKSTLDSGVPLFRICWICLGVPLHPLISGHILLLRIWPERVGTGRETLGPGTRLFADDEMIIVDANGRWRFRIYLLKGENSLST
jgi:hypothetical protein